MKGIRNSMALGVMGIALLTWGCGDRQRDATEAAISAAQQAVDSVQEQAGKYVPDQLAAARKTLQSAREALAKRDYQSALNDARDAANRAKEMIVAAAGKKEEWERTWKDLNESLPKAMDQVKARLEVYARHLPEGMPEEVLEQAKAVYAQMKQSWEDAKTAAQNGKLGEAIEKATGAKEMMEKLREALGMNVKKEPVKPKTETGAQP